MKYFVIFLMTVFLTACGGERKNDPIETGSTDVIQQALVENQILPNIASFLTEATAFNSEAVSFCTSPSSSGLTSLQTGWKSLSTGWSAIEHLNFGPINDDLFTARIDFINSYRLRGTDYTETVRSFVTTQLASNDAIDFDSLNFNQVGLLALQVVLFETSNSQHSQLTSDILGDFNANSRKCTLLLGYADQIKRHAQYISDGWNLDHQNTGKSYQEIYLSGTLEDGSEALTTLLTKTQEHLDYIKKRHVITSTAQLAQAQYQNAQASIDAIELMLEGTTDNNFLAYMIAAGFENDAATVRANIQSIKDAITNQDTVSYEAAIGLLDGNFKREIPDALSVDLGINFSDGD